MSLEIYRRGQTWHYRGTVAGRRLRGSTGASDKAIAQRIASEAERAEWRRHLDGPGAHVTMTQAAIAYRKAGKATRFLEAVEDHWRDDRIRDITPEMVRQSARKLYPDAKPATWNRQVIVPTQAIINHAAAMGWCSPIKVKRFPIDPKMKAPATAAWCEAFAENASPHLGALCLFMFGTGARVGQACNLTWADVDLTKRTATITTRKPTPWTRTAHIPARVVAALANIPSNRNSDELVFGFAGTGSIKDNWNAAIERAGIERMTPHCCRHGFATTMLQRGFDVKTVAAGEMQQPCCGPMPMRFRT